MLKVFCRILFLLVSVSFFSCSSFKFNNKTFRHGVASGDPLSDRVIIWTRVSGVRKHKIRGTYQVALDTKFKNIVSSNKFITSAKKDYTVKVDVKNLSPNTRYYYRFKVNGEVSKSGRTKTLPINADSVSLAFASCANLEHQDFFVYKKIGKLKKIDLVIYLGDYIYEDEARLESSVRRHFPETELTMLKDYRQRYAQYRSQKGLILAHQAHPFISVWDDHEIADNAYFSGALKYQKNKGDFFLRKQAAKKAYFEWMPIRERKDGEIYRSVDFGKLLRLVLLDTRLAGRTIQGGPAKDSTLLGREQEKWFFRKIMESKASWNLIGSQVMFSNIYLKPLFDSIDFNTDIWDGYLKSKKRVIKLFDFNKVKNTHIVSGDTHAAWYIKVPDFFKTKVSEISVPSVTSNNYDEAYGDSNLKIRKANLKKRNPWIKFMNLKDNGFVILDIDKDKITAYFHLFLKENKKKIVKFNIPRR